MNLSLFILDTKRSVRHLEIAIHELFIALLRVVGKNDILSFSLTTSSVCDDRFRERQNLLCNVHKPLSCIKLSIGEHRYDMSGDYRAQPQYEQPEKHR